MPQGFECSKVQRWQKAEKWRASLTISFYFFCRRFPFFCFPPRTRLKETPKNQECLAEERKTETEQIEKGIGTQL